ncbi:tRNA (guanosine(46)-N7)-methyltransferase TrmB [Fructilactobacillus lindneri]|uniref:tRNA (guanine-N(7)-)-methyltransferase n=2 Tax=Fructilactobacillus lindneri TaxID=53444 RepID=A0A0R2JUS2_9LACO|nr:tRNA (guanosine(46)-N7)-methyltransferase TrmB [Fructilactobacillus lindneri]ANZ58281.1 tRNA (guanosine(46)-N7)-methyltransferase TrmB [Fructilactobacillus lindneri]ANZ59603.1 tRNA (guanosine(46)-N7)-methyltransferase TrmB [Fructilactobacillus lindneri]KRN79109.1 tRNA (guanine-N(7)-)-methyltransferase [Fructilactobacillus lindneri DSM 20690 = JCM 11027]POH04001.1 tRNA (guanosine(46)-N7)-methyltransferase TrmB [Fructilactobacillus lindneri]POH04757.1 tRNA (guanosine(46)-N7)-methyltransferase
MRVRKKKWAIPYMDKHPEYLINDPEKYLGKWENRFKNNAPIHVEIGSGKGQFIIGMAKKHPEINYIGIEIQDSVLAMAVNKAVDNQLPNVQLVLTDGKDVDSFFEKGEIQKLYLNFSDPWPKTRHEKRRLTSPKFLQSYQNVLPKNAELEFKTDNRGLFEYSLVSLNNFGMKFSSVNLNLHHSDEEIIANNVETEYEEKYKEKGPIYKIVAQFT